MGSIRRRFYVTQKFKARIFSIIVLLVVLVLFLWTIGFSTKDSLTLSMRQILKSNHDDATCDYRHYAETNIDSNDFIELLRRGAFKYDSPRLLRYVKKHLLLPPSNLNIKIESENASKSYAQLGQDLLIDNLLKGKTNGFFIEAGAYDGETFSNTLYFERKRNWTGLLVEADPKLFYLLKNKNRRAFISNACLSVKNYAESVNFTFGNALGGIEATEYTEYILGNGLVQCIPLITYLTVLNITHVDYLSLDIEGTEIDVIKQIDFKKYTFNVIMIEYAIFGHPGNETSSRLDELREFFHGTKQYFEVTLIGHQDVIFMRNPTSA